MYYIIQPNFHLLTTQGLLSRINKLHDIILWNILITTKFVYQYINIKSNTSNNDNTGTTSTRDKKHFPIKPLSVARTKRSFLFRKIKLRPFPSYPVLNTAYGTFTAKNKWKPRGPLPSQCSGARLSIKKDRERRGEKSSSRVGSNGCCGRCFSLESKSISRLLVALNGDYVALNWHPDTSYVRRLNFADFRDGRTSAPVPFSTSDNVKSTLNVILVDTPRRIDLLWWPGQVSTYCAIRVICLHASEQYRSNAIGVKRKMETFAGRRKQRDGSLFFNAICPVYDKRETAN